ncbi:DDE superfamily endonuclease [Popillia japonica]|uniref:DDE superfamily endonuclease n=1 Tax=Popillia japonica TaxID=7064 RepID=A0AAW1N7S5_POPJA
MSFKTSQVRVPMRPETTLEILVAALELSKFTFLAGSISDKKITANCGVLKEFVAGDLIVADKGFLIAELLPPGVALNLPPFLYNSQFTEEEAVMTRTIARARIHVERAITEEEAVMTRTIARARIHVERAINRIKSHKILNMIPEHLIPHASVVFQVCAALTNLRFPLIKEVEGLYDY